MACRRAPSPGCPSRVEGTGEIVEFQPIGLKPEQRVLEPRDKSAQAPVRCDVVNDRLAVDQAGSRARQLIRRQEKKRMMAEETRFADVGDRLELRFVLLERMRQRRRRRGGELRRRRLDHASRRSNRRNAFSNASSRCRHGTSVGSRASMSELNRKLRRRSRNTPRRGPGRPRPPAANGQGRNQ